MHSNESATGNTVDYTCIGENIWEQFGSSNNGEAITLTSLEGTDVSFDVYALDVDTVTSDSLTLGGSHWCSRGSEPQSRDRIQCAGGNEFGQLGIPRPVRTTPVKVQATETSTTKWIDVSAGREHTRAIDENSQLHCWGQFLTGKLGSRASTDVSRKHEQYPCQHSHCGSDES